ncbi:MAG: HlyD family efflux transporter periplasmic adaptor subunit [Lacunisphaera sp.]|nr:HlyD family efflux transporter periplasmic adaptor subunit [Lacunisphaera sp.]
MKNYSPADPLVCRLVPAVLLAAVLGLGACSRANGTRTGDLLLSGNIEVVDAQLGFKLPGRVATRPVSEGEQVQAGQLIARLEDTEQQQQVALRRAELDAVAAALAELEAGSRPQEIAAVAAALRSAEAERERVRLDFVRAQELRAKDVIADREFQGMEAQLKVAEARAAEAAERLKLVQAGPRAETILQARARTAQAQAAVALAETQLDYTRLVSPMTGTVLSHNIEPGEFVAAGTPVVTVADTVHVWVRAYLDQSDLGRVRHGQKVVVRTDSFPGRDFAGTVGFIASEAEFTPKTVQTPKERVKLVFRLKVNVENPQDELKPGMPADVVIPEGPKD